MRTQSKETQTHLTPSQAIQILKEGNARFIQNLKANRNLLEQVNATSEGQYPFAVILSCIDSRTSAELIFDQGLGDVFSIRIAGNVLNEDILGSMEFACKVAGAKAIVVLGHTRCGAIKGACDHVEMGNLTTLLSKIQPAVEAEKTETANRTSANGQFVEKVAEINVLQTVANIRKKSSILDELISEGKVGLIGGMYNVETGKVDFYDSSSVNTVDLATLKPELTAQ
jgi:carbonic anhydrase